MNAKLIYAVSAYVLMYVINILFEVLRIMAKYKYFKIFDLFTRPEIISPYTGI